MEVCIIGGGFSGIAAAKACKDKNLIPYIFERDSSIGGTWNENCTQAGTWKSLTLNTNRWATGFSDLEWDNSLPVFPEVKEVSKYLRAYVSKHSLEQYFHFNTTVTYADKIGDVYLIKWQDEEGDHEKEFPALIIANGVFNYQIGSEIDHSEFQGTVIYSSNYKEPSAYIGKKLVIVGNSISACEIGSEAVPYASHISQICRTKKLLFPILDQQGIPNAFKFMNLKHILSTGPLFNNKAGSSEARRRFLSLFGNPSKYNPLLEIDEEAADFEAIVPCKEPYLRGLSEGKIEVISGEFKGFTSNGIVLSDDRVVEAEVVLLATGFRRNLGFLGDNIKNTIKFDPKENGVAMTLYRAMIHHELPKFAFIGYVVAPVFGRFELGSEIAAKWILGTFNLSSQELAQEIEQEDIIRKEIPNKKQFYNFGAYFRELIRMNDLSLQLNDIENQFDINDPPFFAQLLHLEDPEVYEKAKTAAKQIREKFYPYCERPNSDN